MYKSLYRIYRPKKFEDAIGQEYIVNILRNQLIENKVGHAYLFTGVRGTGKTTFAKILAKAVNCLNLKNGEPCLECENCKGIEDGSILDVIEMDAASNTGVDNIREIIDESNYLPTKAKYRVYIIDEVHMLSGGAFNALLKTLEEPPEHVKFILATTEPQKLPATILSRCQRFDFKKVSQEEISNYLEKISKETNIDITKEALDLIGILGEGSVRDSMSILESAKSLIGKIEEKDIRNIIGLPDVKQVIDIIINILEGKDEEAVNIIREILDEGKEPKIIIEEMIRVLEVAYIQEKEKIFKYSKEEKIKIGKIASKDKEKIYLLLKELLKIESNIRWSDKKRTILIANVINLANIFKDNINEEKNTMNPEDILNVLKEKKPEELKEENNNSENTNKDIKEIIENKSEIKSLFVEQDTNGLNTFEEIINNSQKMNITNLQRSLLSRGETIIFALVSNSEVYLKDKDLYFIKNKNIQKENIDQKNAAKDNKTIQIIKEIMKEITNKEFNIIIKGW